MSTKQSVMPSFTENAIEEKYQVGEERKASGDAAFRKGEYREALRYYNEAIMFLQGLDKKGLPSIVPTPTGGADKADEQKTLTKVDVLLELVHLNMAACHLKTENWKRVLYYSDKVLAKNETNVKALFRKAKAQAGLGYTEKAIVILEKLTKENPDDATFKAELTRVKVLEKEADAKSKTKFKGFLNKKPNIVSDDAKTGASSTPTENEPKIFEVTD